MPCPSASSLLLVDRLLHLDALSEYPVAATATAALRLLSCSASSAFFRGNRSRGWPSGCWRPPGSNYGKKACEQRRPDFVIQKRHSGGMSNDVRAAEGLPPYKGPPVAVIGAGAAGCAAALALAEKGIPVTLLDSGRGPGGRLSSRLETTSDGMELLFDHGAQYMTVNYPSVQTLVDKWQAAGLVDVWQARFGSFDFGKRKYSEETLVDDKPKYVGVPGMNSICKSMAAHPGVRAHYRTKVVKLIWKDEGSWILKSERGDSMGVFGAVVVSDKALASDRFHAQTGLPPPLQDAGVPDMYRTLSGVESVPCFTVMAAFPQPLTSVPYDRFTIEDSNLLAGAVRVSSKPGRKGPPNSELWVLHSTVEFGREIVKKEGFSKPSSSSLATIAETLLKEFQEIVPEALKPFHLKAHRWGSSFPTDAVAPEEKCIVDSSKKIVACGDFCVSPRIDGAIVSGLAAAENIYRILNISTAKF